MATSRIVKNFIDYDEEFSDVTGLAPKEDWSLFFQYVNTRLAEKSLEHLKEIEYHIDRIDDRVDDIFKKIDEKSSELYDTVDEIKEILSESEKR